VLSEFPKIRKLKNKTLIDRVFKKGEQVQSGSLAMHYLKSEKNDDSIYISVAVSKKEVCLAVNRNDIKRKIRASIILNQLSIKKKLISGYYMILYKKNKTLTSSSISKNLEQLIKRFKLNN
jgi:ribonuclease P protein component